MTDLPTVHVAFPSGYLQCVVYVVGGPQGAVVIDPGSGACEAEVLDGIRRTGWPVTHALLTHCHVDHALGAWRFRERGLKLVAAPYTAEVLRAGGHQVWYEYPDWVIPTEIDLVPADGAVLDLCGFPIRVLHTPGHTPGCASYLVETEEGRVAFTGDLLTTTAQASWAGSEGFSVAGTLASTEKLLAAAPAVLYRGHGRVAEPAVDFLRRTLDTGRAGEWRLYAEFHPDDRPPACLKKRER